MVMRRILLVMATALMVAMMAATAAPAAFADKGQQGHTTSTQTGGDPTCDPGCTFTETSSGKAGNGTGGPRRNTQNESFNFSALGTDAPLFTDNSTSTGRNSSGGGGGKCTSNLTESGNFDVSSGPTSQQG